MVINQTVYLKPIGDNAGYIKDDIMNHIEEWKITKIGRKYFYVNNKEDSFWELKFDKEDNRQTSNYGCKWSLYFSIQEILDEEESDKINRELRKVFNSYGRLNLNLNKLKRIQEIINE